MNHQNQREMKVVSRHILEFLRGDCMYMQQLTVQNELKQAFLADKKLSTLISRQFPFDYYTSQLRFRAR